MHIVWKILLTLVIVLLAFYVIRLLWTDRIDFQKLWENWSPLPTKKTKEKPTVEYRLIKLPLQYKEGVQVEEILWQKGYASYKFQFENTSKQTTLTDFRIQFTMPCVFVKQTIESQTGCELLQLSQTPAQMGIGSSKEKHTINEPVKVLVNNLTVNAAKINPEARFSLSFIMDPRYAEINGLFDIQYRYTSGPEETTTQQTQHYIRFDKENHNHLSIDTETPLPPTIKLPMKMQPLRPLKFKKDGTVEQLPEKE